MYIIHNFKSNLITNLNHMRRRVAAARYRMICLVLAYCLKQFSLAYYNSSWYNCLFSWQKIMWMKWVRPRISIVHIFKQRMPLSLKYIKLSISLKHCFIQNVFRSLWYLLAFVSRFEIIWIFSKKKIRNQICMIQCLHFVIVMTRQPVIYSGSALLYRIFIFNSMGY